MVFIYDREKDMFILKYLKDIKIGDIIAEVKCICYDPKIECIKKVTNIIYEDDKIIWDGYKL